MTHPPHPVPADVPVLRVMWIGASQASGTQQEAASRLERLRRQEDEREELVEAILGVVNTAVRAHRAAARDPYVAEVTRADPRAVRFGYGEARPLTQGQWTEAFLAPAPRPPAGSRNYFPALCLAARRWKRSTRPPVSTSFCLPV